MGVGHAWEVENGFGSFAQRTVELVREGAHELRREGTVIAEQGTQAPGQGANPVKHGYARSSCCPGGLWCRPCVAPGRRGKLHNVYRRELQVARGRSYGRRGAGSPRTRSRSARLPDTLLGGSIPDACLWISF